MKSHVTKDFRELFAALPERAQRQAEDAYELFRRDPYHASLRYKRVRGTTGYYSARVGMHYRVVGYEDGDDTSGSGSARTRTTTPSSRSSSSKPPLRRG